jgi:hypothetical protein
VQIGELEGHNSELLRHTVECESHCHQLREQALQFDARWRAMSVENERMEREAGSLRLRLQARLVSPGLRQTAAAHHCWRAAWWHCAGGSSGGTRHSYVHTCPSRTRGVDATDWALTRTRCHGRACWGTRCPWRARWRTA